MLPHQAKINVCAGGYANHSSLSITHIDTGYYSTYICMIINREENVELSTFGVNTDFINKAGQSDPERKL